jgi:hypothetical protein
MTTRTREPAATLSTRVDAFTRYADLVTAQLTALGEGDLEAFGLLADRRDELAAEIDAAPSLTELVADDELLSRARAELTRGTEAARVVEESLLAMRQETQHALESLETRGRALRQYLETDAASQATVDISL